MRRQQPATKCTLGESRVAPRGKTLLSLQEAVSGQFDDSPLDEAATNVPPRMHRKGLSTVNPLSSRSPLTSLAVSKEVPILRMDNLPIFDFNSKRLAGGSNKFNGASKKQVLENEITDGDVLFGRGGGTNKHVGNCYFRALGVHYRNKYASSEKEEKNKIARAIIMAVKAVGGRFLKKDDASGNWVEVGDKEALRKARQAIREAHASAQVMKILTYSNTRTVH